MYCQTLESLNYIFSQFPTKASEFSEIMQNNSHCATQGHLRSPISVPMESLHVIPVCE